MFLEVNSIERKLLWFAPSAKLIQRMSQVLKSPVRVGKPGFVELMSRPAAAGCGLTAEVGPFSVPPLPPQTSHNQQRRAGYRVRSDFSA